MRVHAWTLVFDESDVFSITCYQRRSKSDPLVGADKNLDWFYVASPRLCRYSMGLREPREILIPLLVVATDVGINYLDELLNGRGLPVPRVEQFRFQPAEEAFARRIVRRASLARHRANELRVTNPR
jgi:uroporphyrinogen-III synthase